MYVSVDTLPKGEGLKRPPFPFEESKATKREMKNGKKTEVQKTTVVRSATIDCTTQHDPLWQDLIS